MKKIGPSFSEELVAAGLSGLPFAWDEETGAVRVDDPALTADQRQRILQVLAAHDPTKLSQAQLKEKMKRDSRTDFLAYVKAIQLDSTQPQSLQMLSAKLQSFLENL